MNVPEYVQLSFSGVQAVAVVVGFYVARRQLQLLRASLEESGELAKRQNAMDLMARYSSVDFADYRATLRTHKELHKHDEDTSGVLNFFEEVAIAAKHGTANKEILKDYFATSLRFWLGEDYMIDALTRARIEDSADFENLLDLYKEWGGSHPPTLQIKCVEQLPLG